MRGRRDDFLNVDEVERAYLNNKLELGTKIVVRIKETPLSGGEEDNVEHLRRYEHYWKGHAFKNTSSRFIFRRAE